MPTVNARPLFFAAVIAALPQMFQCVKNAVLVAVTV